LKIVKVKKTEIQHPAFLQQRFGENYAQISVDITLKLKSSIKDVARVTHGFVPPLIEELTKKMPQTPQGVTDRDFVFGYEDSGNWVKGIIETDKFLQEYIQHYPKEWGIVQKCLGVARQKGRHACGFVVADKPISSFIPTQIISDYRCTQYDPGSVEAAGGLKMDFLIVTVLTDIEDCIKSIHSRSGRVVPKEAIIGGRRVPRNRLIPYKDGYADVWDLPDDQGVFNDVSSGRTETVFQFNTPGARKWLEHFDYYTDDIQSKKAIDSIGAMAAFTALDRPGPLDAFVEGEGMRHNMLVEYARRMRGEPPIGTAPIFEELLPETKGIMCLAKGTRVKTSAGCVPIEDVSVGSMVQTETGEFRPVLANLKKGRKRVLHVRLSNGEELRLTADHRVLTRRGWVEAGDLVTTDQVKQFWGCDHQVEPDNALLLSQDTASPGLSLESEAAARALFDLLQSSRVCSTLHEKIPGVWNVTSYPEDRMAPDVDGSIWGKVVSVCPGEVVETYDLSVLDVHSFVAGGTVVHNCFQEQLQKMYQNLTGCTGSEAEEFRTFVAKKKMDKVQKAFQPWMDRVGAKLGEENAQKIWDFFVSWGQYGFNLSHSVCYSVIGYACAYLKRHYPLEWWCAVLGNASKNKINESFWRHVGHLVDLPEVSRSGKQYRILNERIVAPITALTGVAEGALDQLMKYHPYQDILDFCQKKEQHCIDNAVPVLDANGAPVMVGKGRGKNKVMVPKIKRGKSALNRTICYKLIVSGCLDSLFPAYVEQDGQLLPIDITDKLMMFQEAEAKVKGKKQKPVDARYMVTDALIRFQMKKGLLPIYSEPLLTAIVKRQTPGIAVRKNAQGRMVALYEWGGDLLPFVRPDKIKVLEEISVLPEGEVIRVATPAYVVDYRPFEYAGKTKEAVSMTLDIEGVRMEVVKWPGRDGALPLHFKEDVSGAVGIAVLKKYKEDKPFSLEDFLVVSHSLKKKEKDDDDNKEEE